MARTPIQQRLFDQGAEDARARRRATPPDGPLAEHYTAGYDSITPDPAPPPAKAAPRRSTGRRPATKRPSRRRAPARRSNRRRSSSMPARSMRSAARAVKAPIESQLVSGMTVIATAVALAALYNALTHATTAGRAISGIARSVAWLDSPRPLPYGPHN